MSNENINFFRLSACVELFLITELKIYCSQINVYLQSIIPDKCISININTKLYLREQSENLLIISSFKIVSIITCEQFKKNMLQKAPPPLHKHSIEGITIHHLSTLSSKKYKYELFLLSC